MASYGAASNMAFNFGNGFFRTRHFQKKYHQVSVNLYDCPNGYTALSTKGLNE